MTEAAVPVRAGGWRGWHKVLLAIAAVALALVLLAVFFPWDLLRGPVNRYVSERTGRHFEITRRLDVQLGRTTRIIADGIEFANPPWAQDPYLVKAESAEIDVRLLPLLKRRIELPAIRLSKPQLGLQMEPDGRRTWALGRDSADPGTIPDIGTLTVDEGSAHFVAAQYGADIRADFAIEGAAAASAPATTTGAVSPQALPLTFRARGRWQKEPFSADGRTGNVLSLGAPLTQPFPAQVNLVSGATRLQARGSLASITSLQGADVGFEMQGRNLADLYRLLGIVLPETPRYAVRGRLTQQGAVWQVAGLDGRLGNSDISGQLSFDRSGAVPFLSGAVHSRALDFDDLAPLVGLREGAPPRRAAGPAGAGPAVPGSAGPSGTERASPAPRAPKASTAKDPARRVLPATPLDVKRLKAMNADVRYAADRVRNAPSLPLERVSARVLLKDGVLVLDPLDLGVAGGKLAGRLRIDGAVQPVAAQVKLQARALELGKLFPTIALTRGSFGKLHGEIDLTGRGDTVASMLGTSSGNVALLMGRGQISNLLLEIAGLDGAEIVKFLLGRDRNVQLRCAASSFDVRQGVMTSRALVLDTVDTVIYGSGQISLADESIDMLLRPYPKDVSFLSLRTPLKVTGTLGAPQGGLASGGLAGRAALALALGAVNPLLALAATIETGPGQDADCAAALREAAAPQASARVNATAPPPPSPSQAPAGSVLGGPPAVAPVQPRNESQRRP